MATTRRIGRTWGMVLALGVVPLLLTGCPKRPSVVGGGPAPAVGATQATPPAPVPAPAPGPVTGEIAGVKDIRFALDRADIQPRYRATLDKAADWLRANPGARLVIEGHCDDSGSAAHNQALGERRARTTRDYLVAKGISAGRMSIVSRGEEQPVCSARTDECRAQNRRAHLLAAR